VVLLAWFVFSLFPLVWLVLLSLKSESEQISTYFEFTPTLRNFGTVLSSEGARLTSVNFSEAVLTSVLNCVGAVLVSLVIGVPAAYAAGRWQYRAPVTSCSPSCPSGSPRADGDRAAVRDLQPARPFRHQPRDDLGAAAGHHALIVWILRSYFQDLPPELEQAALLDGYTRTRAFLMVALPLVRPGIAAAALLAFIFAWNNYVFPLILTGSGTPR